MRNGTSAIAVAVAAFLALLGAALGQDALFKVHMWIAFTVLALGAVVLLRRVSFGPAGAAAYAEDPSGYMDTVVRYGVIATLFWGTAGLLVGVIAASQLACG
jgi:cytochrome c oxidase cbb3-type subunit 1